MLWLLTLEQYRLAYSYSRALLRYGPVKGEVIAIDSTAVKAYSQRGLKNKRGKSDPDARVGRGRRGFILGYKVPHGMLHKL